MLKYKSDAFQAIHEDAVANFEVGAITKKELEEYDRACLVLEIPAMSISKSDALSSWSKSPTPVFASQH
jgi:putative transcriptional regulator